ncbi:hypothetical protein GR28A_00064 [Vibrio phage vB_VcorM_GR28A]|nr:hypothetical protein GR28A_00064 [Vibrio phage vB_VcorM_GR28A]
MPTMTREQILDHIIGRCDAILSVGRMSITDLRKLVGYKNGFCTYMLRGLCAYDREKTENTAREFAKQWKGFSGDYLYPVKAPEGTYLDMKTPHYWVYIDSTFRAMWIDGPYADNRWEYIQALREWCIANKQPLAPEPRKVLVGKHLGIWGIIERYHQEKKNAE